MHWEYFKCKHIIIYQNKSKCERVEIEIPRIFAFQKYITEQLRQ